MIVNFKYKRYYKQLIKNTRLAVNVAKNRL